MGTCISKCKPATEEFKHPIQVKLVISHSPSLSTVSIPRNPSKNQLSPLSYSPTSSTTSSNSSVGTSTTITTTTTTSSTSPSISKDRSFSNEFLWSCIKENPHIIQVDPIPLDLGPTKASIRNTQERQSKTDIAVGKQPIPRRTQSQPTQIARQKSFREEKEKERRSRASLPRRNVGTQSPSRRFNGVTYRDPLKNPVEESRNHGANYRGLSPSPSRRFNGANRGLSPSPSRRFNGQDLPRNPQDETCKNTISRRGLSKSPSRKLNGDACKSITKDQLKENIRPTSCTHQIKSQIDQSVVEDVVSDQESNSLPMEDIDNPLISLDCFIFL
ncbi:uncharacterized protein LOC131244390 [Magnolia sinica]|uniref:uncharacterized protein LOC131244390 n=1 Tax=Magnolia sinica TaxID=86752 RepID=UPI00265A4FF0|nr:uncharacterized protein LOC131244390 [Magnolia sinica]